jgi:hypothetical protein
MSLNLGPEELEQYVNNSPKPIDTEGLRQYGHISGQVTDSQGLEYDVVHLGPEDYMTTEIAEWLIYQTFTNEKAQSNEGDKIRFKDISEIQGMAATEESEEMKGFLEDKGGRSLYMAVRDGRPDALVWFHDLHGNLDDFLLVNHARKHPKIDDDAEPNTLATIASRPYGEEVQEVLEAHLIGHATSRHFSKAKRIRAIIGRFNSSDDTTEMLRQLDPSYEHAGKSVGSLVMICIKIEQAEETGQEQDDTWGVHSEHAGVI